MPPFDPEYIKSDEVLKAIAETSELWPDRVYSISVREKIYQFGFVAIELPQSNVLLVISSSKNLIILGAELGASNFGSTCDLVVV